MTNLLELAERHGVHTELGFGDNIAITQRNSNRVDDEGNRIPPEPASFCK